MNLQFLAENTFVISLKEREDRRKNVTKEMRNQKIAFQFFDGIKDANPIYGCTLALLKLPRRRNFHMFLFLKMMLNLSNHFECQLSPIIGICCIWDPVLIKYMMSIITIGRRSAVGMDILILCGSACMTGSSKKPAVIGIKF